MVAKSDATLTATPDVARCCRADGLAMAIYHLTTKPVSRTGGRSATAAAAYRSAECIHDHTSGETFDYTRKRGVLHAEIVLPTSAAEQDINWPRDRQALWNAAEAAENRSNSRVAREYELALPHEMTAEQRVELVRAFSAKIANRYGVAVDFAVHAPHRKGDLRNDHAHVLTTTREITPTGLGAKAEFEWSDTNGAKKGLVPARQELTLIREQWEELANEHLQALGHDARIDHRSLKDQGIEREPTMHLGPAVSGMERRGIATDVGLRIREERAREARLALERAAELGRLERERESVHESMLVLDRDMGAALAIRDARQSLEAERSAELTRVPSLGVSHDLETERRLARERWAELRKSQALENSKAAGSDKSRIIQPGFDLEAERATARENWLQYKADQAKENDAASQQGREQERTPSKERDRSLEGPDDDFSL